MTTEATTAVKKTAVQTAEKRPRVYGRGKARLQKGPEKTPGSLAAVFRARIPR